MKKIGTQLVVGFPGKKVTTEIKEMIHAYHVGSIILFSHNIGTPEEILSLTTNLQYEAKAAGYEQPLLICVDQENGMVRRLGDGATIFPGAMSLGATGKSDNAFDIGYATAEELKAVGINWNLAPVLDVNNNPANPVIGVRSFGESPEEVARLGKAFSKGMQAAGVASTLKHFPGHGDTNVDSHLDLPVIQHDSERLNQIELYPFKENIEADTVMTAHVYFPALESAPDVPATLSKNVITGLLREKLNFQGVITTDCMEMKAISDTVGTAEGAVLALLAGTDMVMISHTDYLQRAAIEAIVKAVEAGEVSLEQIEESNQRIHKLKEKYLSWDDIYFSGTPAVPAVFGSIQHASLAKDVYLESVTLVKGHEHLPLSTEQETLVLYQDNELTVIVEDKDDSSLSLARLVEAYQPGIGKEKIGNNLSEEEVDKLVEKAAAYNNIIIGTLTLQAYSDQVKLINQLVELGKMVIVVAMKSPYDLAFVPEIPVYIATYEYTKPSVAIAVGTLYGEYQPTGKLPVTVSRFEGPL